MPHLTTLVVVVGVLAVVTPLAKANAQKPAGPRTATVTLVAKPNLPRGAKVIVERRGTMSPHDVILVDLDRATATDLAAAVQTLAGLTRRTGDDPAAVIRAAPRSYTPPPEFDTSHFGKQMKAGLVRLLTAPEITVAGIGRARSVDIHVTLMPGRETAARP